MSINLDSVMFLELHYTTHHTQIISSQIYYGGLTVIATCCLHVINVNHNINGYKCLHGTNQQPMSEITVCSINITVRLLY